MVTLAKRSMSDTELRHRKKLQAAGSRVTSTAGLTALGLLGASAVAGRTGSHAAAKKLRNASINTGIVGSGTGAVSGFNFARIQSEESKRPRPPVVAPKKGTLVKRGERTAAVVTSSITRIGEKVSGPRHAKGKFKLRRLAGGAVKELASDPRPLAYATPHLVGALSKSGGSSDTGRGIPVVAQISAARAVRTANRLEDPARAKRLAAHLAKTPSSAKGAVGQHVTYYKAVAGNRDVRLVRPTVDRWSRTYKGVSQIKNANPRGRQDAHEVIHHPLRARATADNRIIRSIARSSPKSDRPLHRVTFVRIGTKEPVGHRTPTSWTPDERVARKVADYQSTRNRRNADMARKTKVVPKVSRSFRRRILPGELHLVTKPEGMRAMNMSAATPRFRQSERVAVTHVRMDRATPLSKAAEMVNLGSSYRNEGEPAPSRVPARAMGKRKQQGWVLKPRKQFDSEASRDRREKGYGKGLAAGSGALAGGAGYQGVRAGAKLYGAASATATARGHGRIAGQRDAVQSRALGEAKQLRKPGTRLGPKQAAGFEGLAHDAGKSAFKHRQAAMKLVDGRPAQLRAAAKHGGKGAALVAGSAALAAGAKAVTRHREHGGKTYNGWWEHRY